ncbi:MAG: DUF6265 family protein [Casimicrobiaceae bacterium]
MNAEKSLYHRIGALLEATACVVLAQCAWAQTPPAAEPPAKGAPAQPASLPVPSLPSLGWLEGCWQGNVNKRDFREVWLPQRGGMMLGVSQTVSGDKTLDFEYLRMESRADGVYYVASPPGKPEAAFKLAAERVDEEDAHTFDFVDPAREFPQRIGYRRASEGWLYTEVEGKVKGADRKVIYPMRRVDCESGELIKK